MIQNNMCKPQTTNHTRERNKILFVGESTALAHVARPAVLARWADEAGYRVSFACHRRYEYAARSEGLNPVFLNSIEASLFFSRLEKGHFMYTFEELKRYIEDELKLIERLQPDLIVGDLRLTLPISAAISKIPCISLTNAHLAPTRKCILPPPEKGLMGVLPLEMRKTIFSAITPLVYRFWAMPMARIRRYYGMTTLKDFREYYVAGDACLYLDIPEFAVADPIPPNHAYLGPVVWHPRNQPQPALEQLEQGRPLIYISMGSSGDKSHLLQIIQGALETGSNAAVAGVDTAEINAICARFPGWQKRIFMNKFYDPAPVLEHASATLCHGGSGTVYQSLEAGVPVLCFPANVDNNFIVQCVESSGVGLAADYNRMKEQIEMVQKSPFCDAAKRMAQRIRTADTRNRWLNFLDGKLIPFHDRAVSGSHTT